MLKWLHGFFQKTQPVRTERSNWLKAFLELDELNEVQAAAYEITNMSESDQVHVQKVLESWTDRQAVSNLLNFSFLIPEEVRFGYLWDGLNEKEEIYYNLAAILGVQAPEGLGLSDQERSEIKGMLFGYIQLTNDIRALRSTTALIPYISKADTQRLISCAANPNKSVRINLLRLLVRLHGVDRIDALLEEHQGVFPEQVELLRGELYEYYQKIEEAPEEKKGFYRLTLANPVSGYIPNLKDMRYYLKDLTP